MQHALIYDLEIIKAIPDKKFPPVPGIDYCAGWQDHLGMGISVLCAYDTKTDRYRVFTEQNRHAFAELAADRLCVTFNGLAFDNKVMEAVWNFDINALPNYDILVEVWAANNLGPRFSYPSHIGYGLDAIAEATFGEKKSGNGALAPIWWQQGKIGDVVDYCLQDVRLTAQLFTVICRDFSLINPKTMQPMRLRNPFPKGDDMT